MCTTLTKKSSSSSFHLWNKGPLNFVNETKLVLMSPNTKTKIGQGLFLWVQYSGKTIVTYWKCQGALRPFHTMV